MCVLSVTKRCSRGSLLISEGVCFIVLHRVFIVVVLVLLVVWIALDTGKRPEQLISFGGVCMFVVLIFLLSAHRAAVSTLHSVKDDSL